MLSPSKNKDTVFVNEIEVLFPELIDEKIRTVEFLDAARGVVRIVEKLGKVFAPVKYDIQGNIDKLTARYAMDKEKNATLQDMILLEKAENTTNTKLVAVDALLWLTRGLHMILLFFEKIVEDAKTGTPTDDLVAFLKKSYKEALEPYHGWMAQQLFDLLSRMVPSRPQFLQAINSKQINEESLLINEMETYLMHLRTNVTAIQVFYKTHNLDALV